MTILKKIKIERSINGQEFNGWIVAIIKGVAIIGIALVIGYFIMVSWAKRTGLIWGGKECQEALQILEKLRSSGVFEMEQGTFNPKDYGVHLVYPPDCKPKFLESLALTLQHPQPQIRLVAIEQLGQIDDPKAAKLLIQALDDADKDVSWEAYQQLLRCIQVQMKSYMVREVQNNIEAYRRKFQ